MLEALPYHSSACHSNVSNHKSLAICYVGIIGYCGPFSSRFRLLKVFAGRNLLSYQVGRSHDLSQHWGIKCEDFPLEEHYYRFGILKAFISENGTQFKNHKIKEFCKEYGINQYFSGVSFSQGNNLAEPSNKFNLEGFKKRLEDAKGRWVQVLPPNLWASRTIPHLSIGETPYSLTYGTVAIIP